MSDHRAERNSALMVSAMTGQLANFLLYYRGGIEEVETKLTVLQEEYKLQSYNPIERISSRLKTPQSILDKVIRQNIEPSFDSIRANITDIAGVRVTCSFIADTYRISEALCAQQDVNVLKRKDYIAEPKPNGYRSLHLIVEVPVFLSDGPRPVIVEVQLRTMAMDFWASLEHKIYYKYGKEVPAELLESLTDAANAAAALDQRMQRLHRELHGSDPISAPRFGVTDEIVEAFIALMGDDIPAEIGESLEESVEEGAGDECDGAGR